MSAPLFEKAFAEVSALAQRFHAHLDAYKAPTYSEKAVREDFINKFFKALGWDVDHEYQHNPFEQEVKVEKTQMQQGARAQRFADYAFYLGPDFATEKFFVEAKKPSVELRNEDHYFQTIRYGWNAGCPVSILTDFEQFHIIDCRIKPDIRHVFNGHHREYTYLDYSDRDRFSEIYWLFSREAVAAGNIERYAAAMPRPKGKAAQKQLQKATFQSIDDSFLEYIDTIRESLARAFKKANPALDSWQLTEATQKAVDRLVFIRFLEDKGIEPNDIITNWGRRSKSAWADFITECRALDAKYNGVVFKKHFIDEPGSIGADEKLFAQICADISAHNSPYNFNYIPIHILGSIYERFLGKVVVATARRVAIEEKPEVRKAGGVYYTPKYIVDYIVANTIGTLIAGKSPREIAAMHFADIACGSGSFLIGVYDYLLAYHSRYYNDKYKDRSEPLDKRNEDFGNVTLRDGQWVLTLRLKQDILINNVFGVDIDPQAVEVTQLSLFLKMLEDETLATTYNQGTLVGKVLPDLTKNIQCGNSVIGMDIEDGQLFELDTLRKINPFDYGAAFPRIMRAGGFDAVVGNPPYVRQESLGEQKDYFAKKYRVYHGMADLFTYFFERGISLLRPGGLFGIIVANKWMRANYGGPLRRWLAAKDIRQIIDFGDLPVFQSATTYPLIIISGSGPAATHFQVAAPDTLQYPDGLQAYLNEHLQDYPFASLDDKGWNLAGADGLALLQKLQSSGTTLKEYVGGKIYRGVLTGLNEAFVIDAATRNRLIAEDPNSAHIIKPFLAGRDIKRYESLPSGKYLVLFEKGITKASGGSTAPLKWLKENYPAIANYLLPFKEAAEKRYDKGEYWWELRACDYYPAFEKTKIIVPAIVKSASYTIDSTGYYSNDKTCIIETEDLYLLAVINSKACDYYLKSIASTKQNGYYEYKPMYVSKLPIPLANQKVRDQLSTLVTQLLTARQQLATATTTRDQHFLENRCAALDHQIDQLVYTLYNLTDEEIRMVEERS